MKKTQMRPDEWISKRGELKVDPDVCRKEDNGVYRARLKDFRRLGPPCGTAAMISMAMAMGRG